MASSSVSQEDVENDFELTSRRSRIRSARARTTNAARLDAPQDIDDAFCDLKHGETACNAQADHDASPKPLGRCKEKRGPRCAPVRQPLADHINRANHLNKGKQQRDRRKLREKRRSTGVVHLQSTESTGGSTGEDEDEGQMASSLETKINTLQNEQALQTAEFPDRHSNAKPFQQRRNKSPSDLDADDEDNQNQSDSTVSSFAQPRPGTPIADAESVEHLLERAQAENRRLLSLLEEKDRKIIALENRAHQVLTESSVERARLHEEIAGLMRALAALKAK